MKPVPRSSANYARTQQCAACPWKKSTVPARDIPGGYDAEKHKKLAVCSGGFDLNGGHVMACHETTGDRPQACVGWLVWALGLGNSIGMRFAAMQGVFDPSKLVLDGDNYDTLNEMLATAEPKRAR